MIRVAFLSRATAQEVAGQMSSSSVVFIAHHRRHFSVPSQVSIYLQPLRAGRFQIVPFVIRRNDSKGLNE